MKLNHIHIAVRDLKGSIEWLRAVWLVEPTFASDRIAEIPLGDVAILLDASERDSVVTLGFSSTNCDADFRTAVARGAVVIAAPSDKPWGARAAYLKGPGGLTFEIEQLLRSK
jgi:uncharacterized glyoxalase superfamily protein PhnB